MLSDEMVITPLKNRIPLGSKGGVWRTYVPLAQAVILTDEKVYRAWHSGRDEEVRFGALENILAPRTKRTVAKLRAESRSMIFEDRFLGTTLVLIPSTDCHLRCLYCYAAADNSPKSLTSRMEVSIAEVGIRAVCRNAALHQAAVGKPVTAKLTFLGGGEPTLDWPLFTTVVEKAHACARGYAVPLKLSLVTNGVLSEDRARWIGDTVDVVHVSVDGPPDIQDLQRPFSGGDGSSGVVYRAAEILCSSKARTTIRATVTDLGVARGKEIASYLFGRFPALRCVHFEPATKTFAGRNLFMAPEPAEFVGFLKDAVRVADDMGMEGKVWSTVMTTRVKAFSCASSQGRACHITPSGSVTSCNEVIYPSDPGWHKFRLGSVNVEEQEIKLDPAYVQRSIRESGIPNSSRPECVGCIAQWHCRGGCRAHYLAHPSEWQGVFCSMVQPLTKWLLERFVEKAERSGRVLDNGLHVKDGRDDGVFGVVAIPDVPGPELYQ